MLFNSHYMICNSWNNYNTNKCSMQENLDLVEQTIEYVRTQIKEHTYLGPDARFVTEPEYPEFAWKEIIVNAIAHRDYSIKGTDIQIKMFDDHITVESPGTLPGTVRLNNMREIHFSRNPKMAQLLHEYEYVREFGEGVDRMYRELEETGLPEPEYRTVAFMVHATIKNKKYLVGENPVEQSIDNTSKASDSNVPKHQNEALDEALETKIVMLMKTNAKIKQTEIAEELKVSRATVQRAIQVLVEKNTIERVGGKRYGSWQVNI